MSDDIYDVIVIYILCIVYTLNIYIYIYAYTAFIRKYLYDYHNRLSDKKKYTYRLYNTIYRINKNNNKSV